MALNILPLREITLTARNYTIEAIIIEKSIPRKSTKSASQYQRFVLQDIEVIHLYITAYICKLYFCTYTNPFQTHFCITSIKLQGTKNPGNSFRHRYSRFREYTKVIPCVFNNKCCR